MNRAWGELALGADAQGGARLDEVGFDHGEADRHGPEHRGDGRAGDGADRGLAFFAHFEDLRAAGGLMDFWMLGGDAFFVEFDRDDLLGAGISRVHPRDNFLSEIAALCETHARVEHAGFDREIGIGEINVVERSARFDPGGVDRQPARWTGLE